MARYLVQEKLTEGEGLLGTRVHPGAKWLSVPVSGGTGPQRLGPGWNQGEVRGGGGAGRDSPDPLLEWLLELPLEKKTRSWNGLWGVTSPCLTVNLFRRQW